MMHLKMEGVKYLLFLFLLTTNTINAQTVTNGNFTASGTGWGCSPETNPQSTYGGTGTNRCAEVDAAAGLCQTIAGFTPGAIYQLTFSASRRTGGCPGPNPATINVVISGGALSTTATRTNATFGYTTETILFTATAASHTLTISAAFGGTTCGIIIDEVAIVLFSGLPVEFGGFDYQCGNDRNVNFKWNTFSETNNNFFTLKKSANAIEWENIAQIQGAGNSNLPNEYTFSVNDFSLNAPYYSLSQTDFDGTSKLLQTTYVDCKADNNSNINISLSNNLLEFDMPIESIGKISIFSSSGQLIFSGDKKRNEMLTLNVRDWNRGVYFISFVDDSFTRLDLKFYLD